MRNWRDPGPLKGDIFVGSSSCRVLCHNEGYVDIFRQNDTIRENPFVTKEMIDGNYDSGI